MDIERRHRASVRDMTNARGRACKLPLYSAHLIVERDWELHKQEQEGMGKEMEIEYKRG